MKKIRKRNGTIVPFDASKIAMAIKKANKAVSSSDAATQDDIRWIISKIENNNSLNDVESIQDKIIELLFLIRKTKLASEYSQYREKRNLGRKLAGNTTDETILTLIKGTNSAVMDENSNKNALIASTQRDLIAGEVSRDLTNRLLLPEEIVKAHQDGVLHFHDSDYFISPIFNCCLINIKDMLGNGTVINGKLIESPKSFQVACTVTTQIIATVASNQYGGQSINIKHLGKYLRKSRQKYEKKYTERFGDKLSKEDIIQMTEERLYDELKAGVQTIQYQINTLMTTNGQSPFVTIFLEIDESDEYVEEAALIIKEILRQRLEGIKNEQGVYITPAFPKLIYVLDKHNNLSGGKYDEVTKLAIKCSSKRMYPDYISAKKMRENYDGEVFSCMGCRSFLSPWKDENGKYKWEGRFNQGVVSLNLPQIGIIADGDEEIFWQLMDDRLELCFKALMCRHEALKGTLSDVSPIHWQYGAIARLGKGEKIDKLLMDGYSTISLGYIGLYEVTKLMTGESHTTGTGLKFALKVMNRLKEATETWKMETGLGFGLYGTPAESLCYRFARIDKEKYGDIEDVTDKGYYTNSYHVDVREKISIFEKFAFESQFQNISSGGAISYAEIPNMENNLTALEEIVKFIYDNIQYAEFNTKSDYCHVCGFEGEIPTNENYVWECPRCHNTDRKKLTVTRRTCGYLGENFWNVGKTKEISSRVLHI